ncbi:hypothetical protein CcCBS67573_g02064 [Chytriomyces confervae]|uniref:FAD-binding FR-type domain-containing protein n=1 Tax=Chytriomyces confervae TaxID=246404 RepID=A0A507FKA1_9FUNG|nr:hypothetical protein CcCBS67573_g02064 [Chytriomyces confervae]
MPTLADSPVAWLLGSDNLRAALVLAACQAALIAVHLLATAILPRFAVRSTAGVRHSASSVVFHKLANWRMASSLAMTAQSAKPTSTPSKIASMASSLICIQSVSIVTLLLVFSLGTALDPNVTSDVGHQRMGRFAVVYAALALALPTRNSLLATVLLNTSFKDALKWHIWTASAAVILALVHSISYFILWMQSNHVEASLSSTQIRNRYGLAASSLMLLVFLSSLYPVRRYAYQLFYTLHILTIPIVLTLVYLHTPTTALPYLTGPLALYIVDKGIRLMKSTRRVKVLAVESLHDAADAASTTMLTVCIPPLCQHGGFKPGQFVFVNIPEISSTKWHPVSLSSHSPTLTNTESVSKCCSESTKLSQEHPCTGCRIVFSGRGPFPRALNAIASSRLLCNPDSLSPLLMHMDGPYGHSHAHSYFSRNSAGAYMYIAGGIGVTPVLSLLLSNVSPTQASGCCHSPDDASPAKVVPNKHQERILVWSVKCLRHAGWAIDDLLACAHAGVSVLIHVTAEEQDSGSVTTLEQQQQEGNGSDENLDTEAGLSREDDALLSGWMGQQTHSDALADVANGLVPRVRVVFGKRPEYGRLFTELKQRRYASAQFVGDCGVIVSGPAELVSSVQWHAVQESDETCLFHVFTESFEL